ncbi:putative transcriptional regulator [Treponema primitia ZAS-2]|uniref:Putative transcriptional regulator n=1 Tax=Treponema primitia (strain ATCC BAA-887 / DSM 12427 / ZAS-2) TaxID=545694 RepID=F5YJL0_TREPZ|nr:LuxR C-terminal-related transcriptional regulator [Treponema primitia]AEF86147.1 putative transcriptional regulator [Treponema primitia ZAS-2]
MYLERKRINRLLEKALQNPVVTVVAGAGFGKTRAVLSFLRGEAGLSRWLPVSEWNTHAPVSLRDFRPENPKARCVLVLDDLQFARGPDLSGLLEEFLGAPYPNMRVILISRQELALSKGKVGRITWEDLRFREAEIRDYLLLRNISVPPGMVEEIYQRTEGWAFAVHLAARALEQGRLRAERSLSSIRANIFRFIETEIFNPLPENLKKFLIKLSLIEPWPAALVQELSGDTGLIPLMEGVNSLIVYDPAEKRYRVHGLFLKFLVEKQGELGEGEQQDIYARSAHWYLEHGMKQEALACYGKAGDYRGIIKLVFSLPQIIPQDTARALLELSENLLGEGKDPDFLRRAVRPRLLFILGRFDDAVAASRETIDLYEGRPVSPEDNLILYFAYIILGFASLLSCVHTKRRDFCVFFEQAWVYYRRNPVRLDGPISSANAGPYVCRVGYPPEKNEIPDFINALAEAIPPLADSMGGAFYGMEDLAWAEFALYQGDLLRGEIYSHRALRKAREKGQFEIETQALFFLLRINLAEGRLEQTAELLKQLEAGIRVEFPDQRIRYDIHSGWFFIHIGLPRRLAPWLKNDFDRGALPSLLNGTAALVKAKYFYAQKRYPLALASLEEQKGEYGLGAFLFGKIEMKVLEALCLYRGKRKDAALAALEEAWRMAEGDALEMPFIEMGRDMRTLVSTAIKYEKPGAPREWLERILRKSSAYAKKTYAAAEQYRELYKKASVTAPLSPGVTLTSGTTLTSGVTLTPGTTLTSREMQVLTGLSQGLTREEIARDGGISINTVKSVIRTVYRKLSAVNRADAVRIAIARKILTKNEET